MKMASTPSPGGSETLPSSPSSTSGAQTAKAKRYDRQLRLWGDHGQTRLEKSRVCVIGATATSTEILKSLVLPGVGRFTIVDANKITGEDVGNNFFLEREHIGQSRGSVATRLLLELNPEVRGDCVDESVDQVLRDRPDFFYNFNLVIATDISERAVISLSTRLWDANIPFMVVRSYGLLGYIRLQIREHTIMESHPDNVLEDLRLDVPFDELVSYMNTQDLDAMTKNEYMHTPYVVILFKYLQKWKAEHDGNSPHNYKEKRDFKAFIKSNMNEREDVKNEELENFEEAIRAVNTALEPTKIPSNTKAILDDPKCVELSAKSEDFWIIARAVKDFIESPESNNLLPVRGKIPDMFADSERYIQLINIYRHKAAADAENVYKRVQHRLESIGRSTESISEAAVRKFCKEASNLRLHRDSGSIADEYNGRISARNNDLVSTLEQSPDGEESYYLILRGVDRFRSDFNVIPGSDDDHVEPDIGRLKNCVVKVINEWNPSVASNVIKDDYLHEVSRYGGAELHAMAAFIGGCAAHEAIKLMTKQYVPVDNLFLFNAMTMNTVTLKIA